jgi:hypothetical protein
MAGNLPAIPRKQLTKGAKLPEAFGAIIDLEAWAQSIVYGTPYKDPNPEYISMMLAMLTITAESEMEVWEQNGVIGVQKLVPDQPGAKSDPFEITDLYVTASDFTTGAPCFCIISGRYLGSGEDFKCTTGALNIQATLIGLLKLGTWPIRCKFLRGDTKDKGDKYLLFLMPPD